MSLIINIFYS